MVKEFKYSIEDVREFIGNSINGSFVDDYTKKIWRNEWLEEFDNLRNFLN